MIEHPATLPKVVESDSFTAEQREIQALVRALARERIEPRAAEIDTTAEFPWDVVEVFRDNGLFGLMFDEEYGRVGASALMTLVAIEEVAKVCATSALILAVQELGALGIKLAGSDEQKQRFLPKLASGEWLAAYALTEAGSGSDSAAMQSEARRGATRRLHHQRHEALHHKRWRRSPVCVFCEDRSGRRPRRDQRVCRGSGHAGVPGGADRAEDGDQGLDHG
jgi:alkylation response protein AidB-like acyl-CoA dehydrogenase